MSGSLYHSQPVVDVVAEVGLIVIVVWNVVVVEVVVVVAVVVVVVVVSVIIESAMFIFYLELEYYRVCSFSLQII